MIKKYFSPISFLFSLLLLIIVFYRSEIQWDGNLRDHYSKYYLFSFFLISFSIFSFFLNENVKLYLSIITISVLVSLYLFEGYLNFKSTNLSKSKIYEKFERETGKKFDKKTFIEAFTDGLQNNPKLISPTLPFMFLNDENLKIFPLSGQSNSENLYCNENGFYSEFSTDRYGFNNPDEVWLTKEVEYVIIGDSYAYGNCVNRPDDISSVIREITRKNSINLGQSGSGPLIELAILKEYLPKNVGKVVWLYYEGNDLGDLKVELKNAILKKYLLDKNFNQKLIDKQNLINSLVKNKFIENYNNREKKTSLISYLRKFIVLTNLRRTFIPVGFKVPSEFKEIMSLAKEFCDKNNTELIFVYIPEFSRLKNENFDNKNYNKIKSIIAGLNIDFIDLNKILITERNDPKRFWPLIGGGAHFNDKGYFEVAKIILNFKN